MQNQHKQEIEHQRTWTWIFPQQVVGTFIAIMGFLNVFNGSNRGRQVYHKTGTNSSRSQPLARTSNLAEVERIIDLADKPTNQEEMHHQFCVDNSDNGIVVI